MIILTVLIKAQLTRIVFTIIMLHGCRGRKDAKNLSRKSQEKY